MTYRTGPVAGADPGGGMMRGSGPIAASVWTFQPPALPSEEKRSRGQCRPPTRGSFQRRRTPCEAGNWRKLRQAPRLPPDRSGPAAALLPWGSGGGGSPALQQGPRRLAVGTRAETHPLCAFVPALAAVVHCAAPFRHLGHIRHLPAVSHPLLELYGRMARSVGRQLSAKSGWRGQAWKLTVISPEIGDAPP